MKRPSNYFPVISLFSLGLLADWGSADTIHFENFNEDDGEYTAMEFNPLGASGFRVWEIRRNGVDGSNAWCVDGAEVGIPFELLLTSPPITIANTGPVTLEFDHLFNFESTWDGGVVMINVNNAGFTHLPQQQFILDGYTEMMQTGADWGFADSMIGLNVFGGSTFGIFVHSVANLGELNAGDTLEIQFRGGWDWNTLEGPPAWVVDNVKLTQEFVPTQNLTLGIEAPSGGMLTVNVGDIPEGQTFHLRTSTDGETFIPLPAAIDFDDSTPQPLAFPIDLTLRPTLLVQVFEGPSSGP